MSAQIIILPVIRAMNAPAANVDHFLGGVIKVVSPTPSKSWGWFMKNTYPQSKSPSQRLSHLRLAASNREPEYGATREEFEERVFRVASHFNIMRFGTHNGSEIKTVKSFAVAVYLAHNNPRMLIYAVTDEGQAFCIPKKDYGKYAQLWLSMNKSEERA